MASHATLLAVVLAAATAVEAESPPKRDGEALFREHCSPCHGREGHGDGPMAGLLRFAPPDLTRLAARNHGRFDAEQVARIVDGRRPLAGHGGPDMPIWGDLFKRENEGYDEDSVRERIRAVVAWLEKRQER